MWWHIRQRWAAVDWSGEVVADVLAVYTAGDCHWRPSSCYSVLLRPRSPLTAYTPSSDLHPARLNTVSQKTSHIWLAITLMHGNGFWYFFGRNVTDKVGNQTTLYNATSSNLCFCTTCQNGETWKSHFSLNWIVLHTQCTCALSSWKKKIVICDVFDSV